MSRTLSDICWFFSKFCSALLLGLIFLNAPSAIAETTFCIEETANLSRTQSHLNAVIKEFVVLIGDYTEASPEAAVSELRLSNLKDKANQVEKLLTDAGYTDIQREIFIQQIKKLIKAHLSETSDKEQRETIIETEIRKLESNLLSPFTEDEDSDFAKNFKREYRNKVANQAYKMSLAADGHHYVIFQNSTATIFDAITGYALKEINIDNPNILKGRKTKFELSADGRNMILVDDENNIYSASLDDLLHEPNYTIDFRVQKNLWWSFKGFDGASLKGFFPLNKTEVLTLSSDFDFDHTQIIDVRGKNIFTPLTLPLEMGSSPSRSNQWVSTSSLDTSLLGIFTDERKGNEVFFSIFDLRTKAFKGRLVYGDLIEGFVKKYSFVPKAQLVVGLTSKGIAFWPLNNIKVDEPTKATAFLPFVDGRTLDIVNPTQSASSPDGKYLATITSKNGYNFIEIYQLENGQIAPFLIQSVKIKNGIGANDWSNVMALQFSADSRRLIGIQNRGEPIIFKTNL